MIINRFNLFGAIVSPIFHLSCIIRGHVETVTTDLQSKKNGFTPSKNTGSMKPSWNSIEADQCLQPCNIYNGQKFVTLLFSFMTELPIK